MCILFQRRIQWLAVAGISFLAGCIDSFSPEAPAATPAFLVVDGFINGQGRTRIRLSRATALKAVKASLTETRATVYIENEAGARFPLRETQAGFYISDSLQLAQQQRYRLWFRTGSQEYASAFVPLNTTPPIDNITWRARNGGVQVYVNAHDTPAHTRYFRWSYVETWEYATPYVSLLDYKPPGGVYTSPPLKGIVSLRNPLINRCWRTLNSTDIVLGNTLRLSSNIVSEQPVRLISPALLDRLQIRYSLLVRQYAQSAEEYAYWEQMKKNTESLGTLFDPLPTQLTGNVHNLASPEEVVLGYVGACTVTEKRFFIRRDELPADIPYRTPYDQCPEPDILQDEELLPYLIYPGTFLILNYNSSYSLIETECADCRKQGGVIQRPVFW